MLKKDVLKTMEFIRNPQIVRGDQFIKMEDISLIQSNHFPLVKC
jgi:hypothetical protein